jgi:hypothetical protein
LHAAKNRVSNYACVLAEDDMLYTVTMTARQSLLPSAHEGQP